jgi:hypothetical protein
MRWLITGLVAVLLVLGVFVVGEYREDQAYLRQHLEERDARHKKIQRWLSEVEQRENPR